MAKEVVNGIKKLKQAYKAFIKETQKKDPNVRKSVARTLVKVATTDLKLLDTLLDIIKLNEEYEKKQCLKN